MILARWRGQQRCCLVRGERFHLAREDVRRRMVALLGFDKEKRRGAMGREAVRDDSTKSETMSKGGVGVTGAGAETRVGVARLAPEVGSGDGKVCVECNTSKTPLWRSGPAGPKTLCNACGIRYRKLRRKGGNGSSGGNKAHWNGGLGSTRNRAAKERSRKAAEAEKLKKTQRRKQEGLLLLIQQSRKFASTCGEEEAEAAVLLMALSTGLFVHS